MHNVIKHEICFEMAQQLMKPLTVKVQTKKETIV